MAQDDSQPLSLRPSPVTDTKPKNIAEFIARVNAQPGGFRSLKESELREQVREQQESQDGQDVDMAETRQEDEEEEDGEDGDGGAKDPQEARIEVLRNIEYVTFCLATNDRTRL